MILAVIGGLYYWRYRIPPNLEHTEIKVENASGGFSAVTDLYDGPILVNFYASWCGHCMQELPVLNKAHSKGQFTVVGVTDDSADKIEAVQNRYSVGFPLLKLENKIKDYGVYSLPTSFLFDANGALLLSKTGPHDWDSEDFMNKVSDLLSD